MPLVFSLHSSCCPRAITYELVSSVTSIWYHRFLKSRIFSHRCSHYHQIQMPLEHLCLCPTGTSDMLCPKWPWLLVPPFPLSLSHAHTHSTFLCLSFSTPSVRSVSIHCPNHLRFILKFVLSLDLFLISDKDAPVLGPHLFSPCVSIMAFKVPLWPTSLQST